MVIQNNWIAGAENKRHRFREALLWKEDERRVLHRHKRSAAEGAPPLQCNTTNCLRFTSRTLCSRAAVCASHSLTNRVLLLPSTCSFTNSSGLVPPPLTYRGRDGSLDENVLDDTVDADWCTTEWFFDMGSMKEYLEGRIVRALLSIQKQRRLSSQQQQRVTTSILFHRSVT